MKHTMEIKYNQSNCNIFMLIFHVDRLNETNEHLIILKVITSFSSAMALRNYRMKNMKADQSPEIIKMTQNNFFPNI